jgi:hypothetical protein
MHGYVIDGAFSAMLMGRSGYWTLLPEAEEIVCVITMWFIMVIRALSYSFAIRVSSEDEGSEEMDVKPSSQTM